MLSTEAQSNVTAIRRSSEGGVIITRLKRPLETTHCIACCGPHVEVFEELRWTTILTSYLFSNLCCHSSVKEKVKQKEEGKWAPSYFRDPAWLTLVNQNGWPSDPQGDSCMVNRESTWTDILINITLNSWMTPCRSYATKMEIILKNWGNKCQKSWIIRQI